MKRLLTRGAWIAVPLAIGVTIGIVWGEIAVTAADSAAAAHKDRAGAKAVKPVKAEQSKKAKPAKPKKLIRVGSAVGLNSKAMDQYVILHKHVWPGVLDQIRKSNIRNYSIYMGELNDGNFYLFAYFEYVGDDFEGDMQAMANDPVTREWWKLTDPLQKRIKSTPTADQWKKLTEVFHTD